MALIEMAVRAAPGWAATRAGSPVALAVRGPGLARLLDDAVRRNILRRAGAGYQFRYAQFQDYLASAYLGGRTEFAPGQVDHVSDLLAGSIENDWLETTLQQMPRDPNDVLLPVFHELPPGGRLVVTGPAASGKCAALLRLQQSLPEVP